MVIAAGGECGHRRSAPEPRHAAAKKAIGALAASILTIVYHMLVSGEFYNDLGPDRFDRRTKAIHTKRLITRLQNLDYAVQITPLPA